MGHDFELLSMISDITFKFNFDFPFAIDAMLFSTSNLFIIINRKFQIKSNLKGCEREGRGGGVGSTDPYLGKSELML